MKTSIVQRLFDLNREFYDSFAGEFSVSRAKLQPGVVKTLEILKGLEPFLDVGCGNARVGFHLAKERDLNEGTFYVGVDFSKKLLSSLGPPPKGVELLAVELGENKWADGLKGQFSPFKSAICLAVLHHLPGRESRLALLKKVKGLIAPEGRFILSVWQFLHVPSLAAKIRPWEEAGFSEEDMDRGDILMTWGQNDRGRRYVHHFEEGELQDLLREAGFAPLNSWRSDGRTGDLGLYIETR